MKIKNSVLMSINGNFENNQILYGWDNSYSGQIQYPLLSRYYSPSETM